MSSLSPSFRSAPPEILYQVIDAAVTQPDVSLALCLAQVASWVRARVDLHIYRTVVLSSAPKIRLFAETVVTRPSSFFAQHVRRLWIASSDGEELGLLPDDSHDIKSILDTCTGVVDLTIEQGYLMENSRSPLRPTSLSVVTSAYIFFLHLNSPVFERVTHLYFLNGQLHHAVVPSIAQLPALTHLAISCSEHANAEFLLKNTATLLKSSTLRRFIITPWSIPIYSPFEIPASFRLAHELGKLRDSRMIVLSENITANEQFRCWKELVLSSDRWWDRVYDRSAL